jgi:hypothetical protein
MMPYTGPEPAFGISYGIAKSTVKDWMNKKQIQQWESLTDSNWQRK